MHSGSGLPPKNGVTTARVLDAGAGGCESPADLARMSDIIITCVSDTPDVEAVILGKNGVINAARSRAPVTPTPLSTTSFCNTVENFQVVSEDLDRDARLDPGQRVVDAVLQG